MFFKTLHRNERKTAKHEPHTKHQGWGVWCSGRVSSCFTCDTRRVTLAKGEGQTIQ